ncbi:MAG: hypothetical protein HYU66_23850, partial [Armatimonadetes bacterium]|nr:hypothetical protein [Armatimonadota bacterium]
MSAAPSRPRWSWTELGGALAVSLALALLTTFPYVRSRLSTPKDQQYLGFVYNPDEPNVHLSWIRQGSEGAVFFRNEFTSEPHVGRFFNLFMLLLGRLARACHATPYQVWAVARVLAGTLLGLAAYLVLLAGVRGRALRQL